MRSDLRSAWLGALALVSAGLLASSAAAQAPGEPDVKGLLQEAHAKFAGVTEGKNADYIPALAKVDSKLFGIALVTVDGKVYEVGDVISPFSIQSISKVFTLARVMQDQGERGRAREGRRRRDGRALQLDRSRSS